MAKPARQIERDLDGMLRACSLEAVGMWCRMRYLIDHESDKPGHLRRGDQPINPRQLAHVAGCSGETAATLLKELGDAKVVETADDGTIYSKPLVRLAEIRNAGARRKRVCVERRALRNTQGNAKVTPGVTKKPPTPASSPALSPSHTLPLTHPTPPPSTPGTGASPGGDAKPLPPELDVPEFRAAWAEWERHRREKRQRLTATARSRQLARLTAMGANRAVAAIEHSIANGWTGIFEGKGNTNERKGANREQAEREFTEDLSL